MKPHSLLFPLFFPNAVNGDRGCQSLTFCLLPKSPYNSRKQKQNATQGHFTLAKPSSLSQIRLAVALSR